MQLNTDDRRIFGLDVFRAIAIILVVLVHGGFILNDTLLEGFPYFNMIDGVDMFFVLSGFLIGGILLKEINKTNSLQAGQLIRFWKRRWFRTLPNYYLILLLNYIIVKHGIIDEDIDQFNIKFLFFLQNFNSPFYGFFWESWSLSIEEWFYLLTPLLILIISRISSARVSFLSATILMIVFPVFYRLYMYNSAYDSFWLDVTIRKTVLCRLDSIGYGLLAAWIQYYFMQTWRKYRYYSFFLGILLILFILNFRSGPSTIYSQIIYFSILPVSAALLLPLAEAYKNAKGVFPWFIEHISKISYSMYLINLALVAEVIRDNFTPRGGLDGIIKYLLYWIIVILASSLLYKYFEKPAMDLRDKKIDLLCIIRRPKQKQ